MADGTIVEMVNLVIPANQIYGFVEAYRTAYFEEHSLDWAKDEILTRGKAEIKRSVKNGEKREKQVAAGKALAKLELTPDQLLAKFAELQAALAELQKAKATE
jgi:hypothetical protein